MKWGLVLAALVLGFLVTWLLTRRRESAPVPVAEHPLPNGGRPGSSRTTDDAERDGASAFGGAVTEFSSDPGPAESWHRDWQDEDALIAHEASPDEGQAAADVPPVPEATPNGDLAGVGEPRAVRAVQPVDAVEVEPDPAAGDEPEGGPVQRR